jgi:hypothetical protein
MFWLTTLSMGCEDCSLFNGAARNAGHISSQDSVTLKKELERTGNEFFWAPFTVSFVVGL